MSPQMMTDGQTMTTFQQTSDIYDISTAIMSSNNLDSSSVENNSISHDNASFYSYYGNSSSHYDYEPFEYDEFVYEIFTFERPVYLYIWNILVIFLFLVNVIVISVLMRRKMRNATNMILSAIAVSDTFTGLVTLPTYIMVYMEHEPLQSEDYSSNNTNLISDDYANVIQAPSEGIILTKDLCRGFMISKYFLSKIFHTVSIFLTLFLAVQRYTSVAYPFKSQRIFTVRNTVIFCIIIFFASPLLHLYHVTSDKAVNGVCQWELGENGCGGDCIYLWILFLIRHFIPCISLTIFTVLFIKHLRGGARIFQNIDSNSSQMVKRREENRRISIIVIGIVVVFLFPEIPYGVFLLYHGIDRLVTNGDTSMLEVNRGIHMGYELLLVLSFNANFYIYTFLNKKFRKCLKRTYLHPLCKIVGGQERFSISKTSSMSTKVTRKTECGSSQGGSAMEMKSLQTSNSDKSVTMQTKLE